VKKGCIADSGSWKIIDILLPRNDSIFAGSAEISSSPSSQISPLIRAPPRPLRSARLCRPRMDIEVTDFPEPDSPTMPSVLPRSSWKEMPSTDLTSPSSVPKCTLRSRTSRKGRPAPRSTLWIANSSLLLGMLCAPRGAGPFPDSDRRNSEADWPP
jgi:hypothetical protein